MGQSTESPERKIGIWKVLCLFILGALVASIIVSPTPKRVQAVAERTLGEEHPFVKYLKEDEESRSLFRLMMAYSFYNVRMWLDEDSDSAAQAKRMEDFYTDPDKYQKYWDMWKCMDEYFEGKREKCTNPLNEPAR